MQNLSKIENFPDIEGKESNLKVGDVILLMSSLPLSASSKYSGVISADGVISKSISLIPKESQHGANVHTRSCLFRIENARRIDKHSEEADSELLMSMGKSLTYGERIQLRHWHSKGFIAVNKTKIALEPACLEIQIKDSGTEDSWFEILPVNKLRRSGEVIKYSDILYLKWTSEKSEYYLHFNAGSIEHIDSKAEINACGKSSYWKMKKYMGFNLALNEGHYVTAGDSLRIFHKISEGYLAVDESLIFNDPENYEEASEPKLFVQKANKSSNSLWELQRVRTFEGGMAKWNEKFRIKHLATGWFLVKLGKELVLAKKMNEDMKGEFELVPQSVTTEEEIQFGLIFSLKNSDELVSVDFKEEVTTFIQKKTRTMYPLSFVKSKKEYSGVAFVFEDVQENMTSHVYKLSLMSPKLQDAYFYFKNSDLSEKILKESPDKESMLNQTCTQLKEMMRNVRTYVIHLNSSEVDVIKRQNSMRELGVIDALLKLSDIIQFKINNSAFLPSFQRDASKFSSKSGTEEKLKLVEHYLNPLETEVYLLIYDSVKNNPKNCRSLIEYENRIVPILAGKNFQVIGKILREMFKYVLELSKYSEKRIKKWFDQLQTIELGTSSIKNQNMYLSMMKYLCQSNGKAAVNYQAQFNSQLFGNSEGSGKPEAMKIIKMHIYDGKPCIELDYNRSKETLKNIISLNSYLSLKTLIKSSLIPNSAPDSAIFLLDDLCSEYDYTRYISLAFDFYNSICLCRYTSGIENVKKHLFVTPEYLILIIRSSINLKLKASAIDFLNTVFINVDPFVPISKFKPRCFTWEETPLVNRLICTEKSLRPEFPSFFEEVLNMVTEFWAGTQTIKHSELGGLLKLVTSYLKLTNVLLDLDVLDNSFMKSFQNVLLLLVMGVSVEGSHWCNELIKNVKEQLVGDYKHSLDVRLTEMLEVVMGVLNTMIIKRENIHVEALCELFFKFRSDNLQHSFRVPQNDEALRMDFENILKELEWNNEIAGTVQHLDIYLLKLLFNSDKNVNKEVRKKALELILTDMNMRKNIKNELASVEFLPTSTDLQMYSKLSNYSKEAYKCIKTLLNYQAENVSKSACIGKIKELSLIFLDIQQIYKTESVNYFSRSRFQAMLRHSNIYEQIILIFDLKTEAHKILYKNCIDLLFNFAYDNGPNQELLLPYVDLFLEKIDIGHGVAKLLAQILRRNYSYRKGSKVIKLISESIDKKNYEFHLLQLLRTFVYDDNQQVIPKMQIDILKWIFNNEKIKAMHFQHASHYDYLDPKLRIPGDTLYMASLKFHCEVMKTLDVCTFQNKFGIQQGRKLISKDNLFKTLKKPELNKYFKKTYFRFLYEVYLAEIEGKIAPALEINHLEEIFENVVLIDLDKGIESIDTLVNLSQRGFYENIVCKKVNNLKIMTFINIVNQAQPSDFEDGDKIKEKRNLKKIKLSPQEQSVLDLWNYFSGGASWHSEKDGLFHILREIFSKGQPFGEVQDLVNKIRQKLKIMCRLLEDAQKKYVSLDFSNIIMIINACREAMFFGAEDAEAEKLDEKVELLVLSLRDSIIDRKMSLEEMFAVFDTDKNGAISKAEFKHGIRCLLDSEMFDLDFCFFYFSGAEDVLDLKQFSNCLRKYFFHKKPVSLRKQGQKRLTTGKFINNPDGYKENTEIMQEFKLFIQKFDQLCKDQDINQLVTKIKLHFVDPAIRENDYSNLKEFVGKLGTAFKKKVHKIYLLQILKLLIPDDLILDEVFDENSKEKLMKLESITKTQEVLSKSGVLELALDIINSEHELELVDEAVQLLIGLLRFGNLKVQEQLLGILKSSENSYLFSYIRLKLRQSRDRIVDRARAVYEKDPGQVESAKLLHHNQVNEEKRENIKGESKSMHVYRLIVLLQLCVENCYLDFQQYIRSQDMDTYGQKAISINMVNELAQYLINIKEVGQELVNDFEARKMIPQCFETLIDLCRGPCVENQLLLGQRRKLYKFVDNLINMRYEASEFFDCCIRFLKVLLDGECLSQIATIMLEEINFQALYDEAFEIYQNKIHNFKNQIIRESVEDEKKLLLLDWLPNTKPMNINDWKRVNSGFDIMIIFLRLKQKFPDSNKLNKLSLDYVNKHGKPLLERIQNIGGRVESLWQGILKIGKKWFIDKDDRSEQVAFDFYLSLLASVEIDRDGKIEQSFFRVPGMIMFLSTDMKDKLLYQLNRNSHEEKVKSIYQRTELCQLHMHHIQQMSRFKTLSWWSSKKISLANISFIILVLINGILLFSISSSSDTNFDIGAFPGTVFKTIFGVLLIILSLLVYLLYIIENYPVILYDHQRKSKDPDLYRLPNQKLRGAIVTKYLANSSKRPRNEQKLLIMEQFFQIIFYSGNIYNLIYFVLSCVGFKTIFVYPFLLLDIVRRNENLRYILKAVTQNKRQLGLTILLGLIFVYLFGVIGFVVFADYYLEDGFYYCGSLISCVTYTLYYGIRAGGGIGENLRNTSKSDSLYGLRTIFDLFFFIIVIIVLLNIIFGIIIDTFGELRDKRKKIEEDINNVCVICGKQKFEFELRGSGWNEHIQLEHNLFSYLAYIIYIRRKPFSECDGLEKSVKLKIRDDNVSFLPKTAMCFVKETEEGENSMLKEIDQGIRNIEKVITKIEHTQVV